MNRLLTPAEIAELLGVKTSTVYQWTHQGFIPHVKLGRFVRFREVDVTKWIDKNAATGTIRRRFDLRRLEI